MIKKTHRRHKTDKEIQSDTDSSRNGSMSSMTRPETQIDYNSHTNFSNTIISAPHKKPAFGNQNDETIGFLI